MTSEPLPPLTRRGVPLDPNLRVLALGTLVNRAGSGALTTTFALYFTRQVGLHPAQVGLALSIGAAAGAIAQVPGGHLGDIRGPKEIVQLATLFGGLFTLALLVTRQLWALIVVMALISAAEAVSNSVRSGYIARIAVGRDGVRFKAYLRAMTNVAIGGGAMLGGLALTIDKPWAYLTVLALDGITSIITAFVYSRLPHLPPAPPREAGEPRLAVLRDVPFVVVTLLTGIVTMHFFVIEVGIPLWISAHTHAPTQMVAVLLIINTAFVALFQVRLSLGSDDVKNSAREMVRGTVFIAVGFAIIGLADGPTRIVAIGILVAGSLVHVVGEMISSGGTWGISMGLAPAERQGQYQGFAGLGFELANVVAPAATTLLCIDWGRPGWFVLGGLIFGAGLALRPATAWALASRERYGAASATG